MAGAGQVNPIAFNSQPKAYWIHCHLRRPVRLRLTLKRDHAYNSIGIEDNATDQGNKTISNPLILGENRKISI